MTSHVCDYCAAVFSSKARLKYHVDREVCRKPEKKCGFCGMVFVCRTRFNEHKIKCEMIDRVTEGVMNGFSETDIALVKQMLVKNPGPLQIARQLRCMHEHLTALTHYFGAPQNRNVINMDMKTSIMQIRDGYGNVIKISRKKGVENIHLRNIRIADSDELRQYAQEPADPVSCAEPRNTIYGESVREIQNTMRDIALTLENDGHYSKLCDVIDALPKEFVEPDYERIMGELYALVTAKGACFPPAGFDALLKGLLTVVIRNVRGRQWLWLRMPEGWRLLEAAEFEHVVHEQTENNMKALSELVWDRHAAGECGQGIASSVSYNVRMFGDSVFKLMDVH